MVGCNRSNVGVRGINNTANKQIQHKQHGYDDFPVKVFRLFININDSSSFYSSRQGFYGRQRVVDLSALTYTGLRKARHSQQHTHKHS